jgi:hypothetical protein
VCVGLRVEPLTTKSATRKRRKITVQIKSKNRQARAINGSNTINRSHNWYVKKAPRSQPQNQKMTERTMHQYSCKRELPFNWRSNIGCTASGSHDCVITHGCLDQICYSCCHPSTRMRHPFLVPSPFWHSSIEGCWMSVDVHVSSNAFLSPVTVLGAMP